MDTDDLTEMAYGIITQAGGVLDVLRSEIGASAYGQKTEDDFLRGVLARLRRIQKSPRVYLDYWNYLEEIDVKVFRNEIADLSSYVEQVLATPYSQRGKPAFE